MPGSADELISQMNRLCIEMTHTRRKSDGKEMRKKVLRRMKQLLKRIGGHARRHRDKLASNHAQTKWSPKQSGNIIDRIDDKLALLPEVIRQAHERIIGGRKLKSKDKILSAHEREIDVIVRGKAGKELEFGNVLFISESIDGVRLKDASLSSKTTEAVVSAGRKASRTAPKPWGGACSRTISGGSPEK